jgi:hypothetical protein
VIDVSDEVGSVQRRHVVALRYAAHQWPGLWSCKLFSQLRKRKLKLQEI